MSTQFAFPLTAIFSAPSFVVFIADMKLKLVQFSTYAKYATTKNAVPTLCVFLGLVEKGRCVSVCMCAHMCVCVRVLLLNSISQ